MILDTVFNSNVKSYEVLDILPKTLLLEYLRKGKKNSGTGKGSILRKMHHLRKKNTKKKTKVHIPKRCKGQYPYKGEICQLN